MTKTSSKTSQTNTKRLEDMTDEDIDYSDIPELTRKELSECLIRFPNKPIDQGGQWHKNTLSPESDEVTDEQLAISRARFWQMVSEKKEQGARLKVLTTD